MASAPLQTLRISQVKKQKFVESYRESKGNITLSAEIANVTRETYYNWLDSDEQFARDVLDAEAGLNDEIRQKLIKQATDSNNIAAIIFYLKSRHPDFKESDKPTVGTLNIQVNMH